MPKFRQLLKHVGDVHKEVIGDGSETQVNHTLDVAIMEARSLPFVLSFNNLTYSFKLKTQNEFQRHIFSPLRLSDGRRTQLGRKFSQ
jgi:hypothetical protein